LPGSTFMAAVALSAWFGGFGPALLAAILGVLALDYFFVSPTFFLRPDAVSDIISLTTFLVVALLISSLSANLRRARELAEAARAEAEATRERTSSILESISDAFASFDRDWRYIYLNQRAGQLTGRRPDELIGESVWEVFPDAQGSVFERECRRAMAEQTPVRFEQHSGLLNAWFEVRAYPSSQGLSVYLQDISERKRSDQALNLLAEVGRVLTDTLDYQTSFRTLARLLVPTLSEIAIVDLLEEDGSSQRAAVAHTDETREAQL